MGSCGRIARLYAHISPVPQWAEQYLAPPALVTAALRLALTAPLVVVLYGIKPMSGFLASGLGIANPGTFLSGPAAGVAGAVGPALLLITSLLFILAVRKGIARRLLWQEAEAERAWARARSARYGTARGATGASAA